jgi:Helix-turn-helix domain
MLEPEALGRHKDDLAAMLRDLRVRAGLTGERLAARCAMSQSKVSKIETGKVIPSVVDVEGPPAARIHSRHGSSARSPGLALVPP